MNVRTDLKILPDEEIISMIKTWPGNFMKYNSKTYIQYFFIYDVKYHDHKLDLICDMFLDDLSTSDRFPVDTEYKKYPDGEFYKKIKYRFFEKGVFENQIENVVSITKDEYIKALKKQMNTIKLIVNEL